MPSTAALPRVSLPEAYYQRKLPRWQPEGASLFLTWRLHGSHLLLGRTGQPFWQHESFDHWVRGRRDLEPILFTLAVGRAIVLGRLPC